ncbi:MAG: hypothetical protein IJG42_10175 [Muribaculaceae bacterium]|nr:hypothetical protein [Muribaculaceae bacterium]
MKTILKLIGGLIAGACIGLIIIIPVMAIIDGESVTTVARTVFEKFTLQKVLGIVWILVAVLLAAVLSIIIHEGGHLVAGLLTGYKFVSFRFFNWTLIRKDGRLQWRNFELEGTGGQCLMAPPDKPLEEIDTRWYNAGGVLANVITTLLAIVLIWACDLPDWLNILLGLMALFGVWGALTNGIPMKLGGVANDGYNLLQLEKDQAAKRTFCNVLELNARNQDGETYGQMPERLFNIPDPIDWKNPMHAAAVLASATRKQAQHQWEESYQQLSEACRHKSEILALYQLELENMMTLACIATGRDDEARQHYTDEVAKYVTRHAPTMSDKQMTTMAVALALEGDRPKAENILGKLEAERHKYIHQGDVAMSLDLMHWFLNHRFHE